MAIFCGSKLHCGLEIDKVFVGTDSHETQNGGVREKQITFLPV